MPSGLALCLGPFPQSWSGVLERSVQLFAFHPETITWQHQAA